MKHLTLVIVSMLFSSALFAQQQTGLSCQEAICLSQNLGTNFRNESNTVNPIPFSCGASESNHFFAFCSYDNEVVLDVYLTNCSARVGMEVVIYSTNNCIDFEEKYCAVSNGLDPIHIVFEPDFDQNYILMLDGVNSGICNFNIQAEGLWEVEDPPVFPLTTLDVDNLSMCLGAQIEVDLVNNGVEECSINYWVQKSGSDAVAMNIDGSKVSLTSIDEGTSEICATASNFCFLEETCFTIVSYIPNVLDLPEQFLVDTGNCVVLDAGPGYDNYRWSTRETTQSILVCPYVSQTYFVTVSESSGCVQTDQVDVLLEGVQLYCDRTLCLSSNLNVTLRNDVPKTLPEFFSCGVTHNNMMFSFTAEQEQVELQIELSNCLWQSLVSDLGLQYVLYKMIDCNTVVEFDCIPSVELNPTILAHNLTPGENYILMVDGFADDICDFVIQATGIVINHSIPLTPALNVTDPVVEMCNGSILKLEVVNDDQQDGKVFYIWEERNDTSIIELKQFGQETLVVGLKEGVARLCVIADNFCNESEEKCITINVGPGPVLDSIPDIYTCDGLVDFCDLNNGFFSPELNPNPLTQGWDVSFHASIDDALTGLNETICPYDLGGSSRSTIYLRTQTDVNCYSIREFTIIAQSEMEQLADIFVCEGPVDLLSMITPVDVNGNQYIEWSYHYSEQDALNELESIFTPILDTGGVETIWVRGIIANGCFAVNSLEVLVGTQEINANYMVSEFFGIYTVEIQLQGASSPYEITWSDGFVGNKQGRLELGFHSVSVIDIAGCQQELTFWILPSPLGAGVVVVENLKGDENFDFQPAKFKESIFVNTIGTRVYPNPASWHSEISISSNKEWDSMEVYDVDGKMLTEIRLSKEQKFVLPSELKAAIYFIRLKNEDGSEFVRLLLL